MTMNDKSTLIRPSVVVLVVVLLTILVAVESLYPIPWAPYFIIYAFLAIFIPLYTKSYKFGSVRLLAEKNVLKVFIIFLILTIVILNAMEYMYLFILSQLDLASNSMYNLNLALDDLALLAAKKFGISVDVAILIYAIYVLIWAPIGEELLYRGYMYSRLREKYGVITANLVSSFFFGIRHATHFLFLLPNYPLVAAMYWVIHAFVFGVLIAYAYEKSETLYVPMIIHFLFNIVSI